MKCLRATTNDASLCVSERREEKRRDDGAIYSIHMSGRGQIASVPIPGSY